jgi:predicted SprT family Zn-dependent metalloprotease
MTTEQKRVFDEAHKYVCACCDGLELRERRISG